MSKISKSIAYGNPAGGAAILRKYNCPPALHVEDMIQKLDKIGNTWTSSYIDFAGAHPEGDFFRDYYTLQTKAVGKHDNCDGDEACEGCSAKANDGQTSDRFMAFYKENQKAIIIGASIIIAALIFKR